MPADLEKLEKWLNYKFADRSLLEKATTHRSFAWEKNVGSGEDHIRSIHNESLEFVGDSVLGFFIAVDLFRRNPTFSEGDLSLMKHRIVSTATLAEKAAEMNLGSYLKLGRGEEKSGGRKKEAMLADAVEAVIAAVFLDGGNETAKNVVLKLFEKELENATPRSSIDFKTRLQEILHSRKLSIPRYEVTETAGPPHDRTFYVRVTWADGEASGVGKTIKAAEMNAASLAISMLGE